MSRSPVHAAIDHVLDWAARPEWAGFFQEVIAEHVDVVMDEFEIPSQQDLAETIGADLFDSVVFQNCLEDFFSRHNEAGESVVDEYLRRRHFKESVIGRNYLKALSKASISMYEVLESVPGSHMVLKDKLRVEEPQRVEEKSGTNYLHKWDIIGARVIEMNGRTMMTGGALVFRPNTADALEAELREEARDLMAEAGSVGDSAGKNHSSLLRVVAEALANDEDLQTSVDAIPAKELKDLSDACRSLEIPEDFEAQINALFAIQITLLTAAPLFTYYWLRQTLSQIKFPRRVVNSDGEDLELIEVSWPIRVSAKRIERRIDGSGRKDICRHAPDATSWDWQGISPLAAPSPAASARRTDGREVITVRSTVVADGPECVSLGTIEIVDDELLLHCNSAARADRGRALIEAMLPGFLGDAVESHSTLAEIQQTAAHRTNEPLTEDAGNPEIEEKARIEAEYLDRHYRSWLDHPLPALDGNTPRYAVETENGRAKVKALLKYMENGESRRTRGTANIPYDFGWMWRDLGLGRPDQ